MSRGRCSRPESSW
eukprot:gene26437-biopygen16457